MASLLIPQSNHKYLQGLRVYQRSVEYAPVYLSEGPKHSTAGCLLSKGEMFLQVLCRKCQRPETSRKPKHPDRRAPAASIFFYITRRQLVKPPPAVGYPQWAKTTRFSTWLLLLMTNFDKIVSMIYKIETHYIISSLFSRVFF